MTSQATDGPVILGFSCSHDASACLVRGGEVIVAVQLERLTRIKRDGRPLLNTRAAADYCLDAADLRPDDVDLFAFNTQNLVPSQVGLSIPFADESFDLFDPTGDRSVFVSHHLAHAFAAHFSSPFDESAVWVVDGSGGTVIEADDLLLRGPELQAYASLDLPRPRPPYHVESSYEFGPTGFCLIDRNVATSFHPMCGSSSLGETYAAVSQYVFGDWQEGGKLMGLAPYGDAARFGPTLLERGDDGLLHFSASWKQWLRRANQRAPAMECRDLAARVQSDLEEALLDRVRRLRERTNLADLAYAGGVALNSVANQRIVEESGMRRFYAMPASHDAGISIGAAAAAHFLATGRTKGKPVGHDFLGRSYAHAEIDDAIAARRSVVHRQSFDVADGVGRLAAGQVLGWFEGGAEFGPRSLGHRSIIAAPFERSMWEHLNRSIKYREEFRPYAPIVPVEAADEFFEMGPDPDSPYMLRIVRVRPQWRERLAAVTHVDGTARVQTVDAVRTPRWHALLTAFGARTGVSVLVNTSMNVRGEPIVETPAQAIDVLLATQMDALVLEDEILTPAARSADPIEDLVLLRPPGLEVTASVTDDGLVFELASRVRRSTPMPIGHDAFMVIGQLDGNVTLGELVERHCADALAAGKVLGVVRSLLDQRLLLARGKEVAA